MQYNILADHLPQVTLIEEEVGELAQVVKRNVFRIRPVERELIAAIGVVGKVTGIHTVTDDEELDIVEESVKRSLVVTLDLVISLFQFHAPFLQFYLYQWQTVDEYGHVVATLLASLNGYLIADLKLVLAPVLLVDKLNPYTFTVFQLEILQVTEFLGFLKAGAAFKIEEYLVKLFISKVFTTMRSQFLLVVLLQLHLEISEQILFLLDGNVLVTHLRQGFNQSLLQNLFALRHTCLLFITLRK